MTARLIADRFALSDVSRPGGMATVYRAHDMERDARVAVKLFNVRVPNERLIEECLNRELQALMGVTHPNVVELIDWGKDDGTGCPYLVFDWYERDLLHVIDESPFDGWDDFARIALGILRGLGALHEHSIAHRDLKPQNVLMTDDGEPRLTDFGISKLERTLNLGVTLAGYGSPPYAPPEVDDGRFTFSRDVHAFAVLVMKALTTAPLNDHSDIDPALGLLDVPADVADLLRACLSSAEERPQSAAAVLSVLEPLQASREANWARAVEVHLSLPSVTRDRLQAALHLTSTDVEDAIRTDLDGFSAVLDEPREDNKGVVRDSDLLLAGTLCRYRARPHDTLPGRLVLVEATRPPQSQLDTIRERGWRGKVQLLFTPPPDEEVAAAHLADFIAQISQQSREVRETGIDQASLFREWRAILSAQLALEDMRGEPIRYSSREVTARRVMFQTSASLPDGLVGQPRLVRPGRGRVVAGEIEDVSQHSIVLFVERGDPADVPVSGDLLFDSEAARFAIERQRAALDAVRFGRSVRSDLGALLLSPSTAAGPEPIKEPVPLQAELDDSKRAALRVGLGDADFTLVQGPPGTGKTTLVAELVAQTLLASPGSRVLVSSQTHVALDNAVERIADLIPGRRILRVGRPERVGSTAEAFTFERQMRQWRDEAIARGREFLRMRANNLGLSLAALDITADKETIETLRKQLRDTRSKIVRREAERRDLEGQLGDLEGLGSQVIELASKVEGAKAETESLRGLAQTFIDVGLELAQALERSEPLQAQLATLTDSIRDGRLQLLELEDQSMVLRMEIANRLKLPADVPPSLDQLVQHLSRADAAADAELAPLLSLHREWEERFGQGTEFNGALMEASAVVAATCVGLAGVPGAIRVEFDLCVLDEASKATATEALVPLSRARRWFVVGDNKQLPPFQEDALLDRKFQESHGISEDVLKTTLFDMLLERLPRETVISLREQRRMLPPIGELISQVFYDGELLSVDRGQPDHVLLALDGPIVWLDTSGHPRRRERQAGTSFVNVLEATAVIQLLGALDLTSGAAGVVTSVVVLTGYAAQVTEIRRQLAASTIPNLDVAVATVDAFQGREADVAVFSLTRSNELGQVGFLRSPARTNVALSRGRDGLAIVGDEGFVRSGPGDLPMKQILGYLRTRDASVSWRSIDS
jgi:serine/threonine protein kinase